MDVSALDDQVRESVSRVLDSLRGHLETALGSHQDELARAAQEATTRIAADAAESAKAEVRRDADREIAELRESAAREAEEQRARLTAEIEELQGRLHESREESQRRLEDVQRRIEESQLQIEAAGRETDTAREEAESARQKADAAREEAETAVRDLEAARKQLDSTREDVEATLRDIEGARRDIEDARRDSDAVRGELRQLHELLRRKDERGAQAARLPAAVRALDDASTFGEVLDSLARSAGREAGSAAVFLVKGDRLRDWRTAGFDFASDQPRLDIALSDSGLMAEAVRGGEGVRQEENGHPLPDFARSEASREAAAWPVSVGGSVVAVLYADGPVADTPDKPYWPAFLDVIARHAGRVLEGITMRQAAGLMTGRPAMLRSSSVGHQSSGSLQ